MQVARYVDGDPKKKDDQGGRDVGELEVYVEKAKSLGSWVQTVLAKQRLLVCSRALFRLLVDPPR